jgi:hypothetical protein
MISRLAELFIQFSQRGAEATKAAVDAMKPALDGASRAADNAGKVADAAFKSVNGTVANIGRVTSEASDAISNGMATASQATNKVTSAVNAASAATQAAGKESTKAMLTAAEAARWLEMAYKSIEKSSRATSRTWADDLRTVLDVARGVGNAVQSVGGMAARGASAVASTVSAGVQALGGMAARGASAVASVVGAGVQAAGQAAAAAGRLLANLGSQAAAGFSTAMAAVGTFATAAMRAAANVGGAIMAAFANNAGPGLTVRMRHEIDQLKSQIKSVADVATSVGGAIAGQFSLAGKLLNEAIGARRSGDVSQVTDQILRQVAALRGLGTAQAEWLRGLVNTHVNLGLFQQQLEKAAQSMQSFARYAAIGFATITGTIGGFVRAGPASSAMGEMLSFQMGFLARSIAGLFTPEIQKAIELVQRATNWFRQLSDRQRENIVHWVEGALAATAVGMILPRLIAGFSAVVAGLKAVTGAMLGVQAASGGVLPLVGALASAFVGVEMGSEQGRQSLGKLFESLQRIVKSIGPVLDDLAKALQPIIDAVVDVVTPAIDALAAAMKQLGTETLSTIIRWGIAGATFMTVLSLVPRIVNGIMAVVNALRAMAVAQTVVNALTGVGWVNIAAALAAGAAMAGTLAALTPDPNKAKGKDADKAAQNRRGELAQRFGGFENVDRSWERIAEQSIKVFGQKDVAEDQLDATNKGNEILGEIADAVKGQQPSVRRGPEYGTV